MIPKAMTIAGSDSGGGAGIQADLKTFAALGVHGSSVITALTAQNTAVVDAVHSVPVDFIKQQFTTVMDDIGTDAIKIGMLASSEIINAVADCISESNIKNIVVDPVMVAASGAKLLEDNAIEALKTKLIPLSLIVTPNIPEAEILAGQKISSVDDMKQAAETIKILGCTHVLIKGGHLKGDEVIDLLYDGKEFVSFKAKKIHKEGHGTGCTLSSAIAANLALKKPLIESVGESIRYVQKALEQGYAVGKHHVVLKHI